MSTPDLKTIAHPLYFDSIGDANNPLPHITFKKNVPHEPTPTEINEDQPSSTTKLLHSLNEIKKANKTISHYESLYRESQSSYNDGKEVPSATSSENKEEEATWWGRKLINAVTGFFSSFFNKTPAVNIEDESFEAPSSIQPLPGRTILAAPQDLKEEQLEKLIVAMALALNQIEVAAKEAEEIILKGPSDVALELAMKTMIDKQTLNSKELINRIIKIQGIASQQIALLREKVSEIRGKLDRNVDISNTLGWINAASTSIVLLSGVALLLSGGTSAVFTTLGMAGGLSEGIGTISKGIIDSNVTSQRGDIQHVATSKSMLYTRTDTNLNDMELLSRAIHNNYEKLIELAALKRDACRQALQQ